MATKAAVATAERSAKSKTLSYENIYLQQCCVNFSYSIPVADPAACANILQQMSLYMKDVAALGKNTELAHSILYRVCESSAHDPFDRLGAWYLVDLLLREAHAEDALPLGHRVLASATAEVMYRLPVLVRYRWMEHDASTARHPALRSAYAQLRRTMLKLAAGPVATELQAAFEKCQSGLVGAAPWQLPARLEDMLWKLRLKNPRPSMCLMVADLFRPTGEDQEHQRHLREIAEGIRSRAVVADRARALENGGVVGLYDIGGIVPAGQQQQPDGAAATGGASGGVHLAAVTGNDHHNVPVTKTAVLAALAAHKNVTGVHVEAQAGARAGSHSDDDDDDDDSSSRNSGVSGSKSRGPTATEDDAAALAKMTTDALRAHDQQLGTKNLLGENAAAAAAQAAGNNHHQHHQHHHQKGGKGAEDSAAQLFCHTPENSPYQPFNRRCVDRVRKWIAAVANKSAFCADCDVWDHSGGEECPCTVLHGGQRAPILSRSRAQQVLIGAGASPDLVRLVGQPDPPAPTPLPGAGMQPRNDSARAAYHRELQELELRQKAATLEILDVIVKAILRSSSSSSSSGGGGSVSSSSRHSAPQQWATLLDAFDVIRYRSADVRERRALVLLASYNLPPSKVLLTDDLAAAANAAAAGNIDGAPKTTVKADGALAIGGSAFVRARTVLTESKRHVEVRRLAAAVMTLNTGYIIPSEGETVTTRLAENVERVRAEDSFLFTLHFVAPTVQTGPLAPDGLPFVEGCGLRDGAGGHFAPPSLPARFVVPVEDTSEDTSKDKNKKKKKPPAESIEEVVRKQWNIIHHLDRSSLALLPACAAEAARKEWGTPDGYFDEGIRRSEMSFHQLTKQQQKKITHIDEYRNRSYSREPSREREQDPASAGPAVIHRPLGVYPRRTPEELHQLEPWDFGVAKRTLAANGIDQSVILRCCAPGKNTAPARDPDTGRFLDEDFRPVQEKLDVVADAVYNNRGARPNDLERLKIAVWLVLERRVPYCNYCYCFGHERRRCVCLNLHSIREAMAELPTPRPVWLQLQSRAAERFIKSCNINSFGSATGPQQQQQQQRNTMMLRPTPSRTDSHGNLMLTQRGAIETFTAALQFFVGNDHPFPEAYAAALSAIGYHYFAFSENPVTVAMAHFFPQQARRLAADADLGSALDQHILTVSAPEFPLEICVLCSSLTHSSIDCPLIQQQSGDAAGGGITPVAFLREIAQRGVSLRDVCAAVVAEQRTNQLQQNKALTLAELSQQQSMLEEGQGAGTAAAAAAARLPARVLEAQRVMIELSKFEGTAVYSSMAVLRNQLQAKFLAARVTPFEREPWRLESLRRSSSSDAHAVEQLDDVGTKREALRLLTARDSRDRTGRLYSAFLDSRDYFGRYRHQVLPPDRRDELAAIGAQRLRWADRETSVHLRFAALARTEFMCLHHAELAVERAVFEQRQSATRDMRNFLSSQVSSATDRSWQRAERETARALQQPPPLPQHQQYGSGYSSQPQPQTAMMHQRPQEPPMGHYLQQQQQQQQQHQYQQHLPAATAAAAPALLSGGFVPPAPPVVVPAPAASIGAAGGGSLLAAPPATTGSGPSLVVDSVGAGAQRRARDGDVAGVSAAGAQHVDDDDDDDDAGFQVVDVKGN